MKFNPIPLITACLLLNIAASAQENRYSIRLQGGSFIPEKNITADRLASLQSKSIAVSGKQYFLLQFETAPSETKRQQLKQSGIELLEYIPSNTYSATVTGNFNIALLNASGLRSVIALTPQQKMQPALAKGNYPAYAMKVAGTIDVWVSFPSSFTTETVITELAKRNIDINELHYTSYRILGLRIGLDRLAELAALACIDYVQPAPREDQLLNNKSMTNARANVIRSSLGRNLDGSGIVIGVGDNADPNNHIDIAGRFIHRQLGTGGNHGLHVMATAAGAGNLNEKYTGYAPKATIVSSLNSGILTNMSAYVQDYGMVITNNSYGLIVDDCETFGVYDLFSRILDQQAAQFPNLQNVFAAGNSGEMNCPGYVPGFHNVLGAYQSAKNVITVGNTRELEHSIFIASSKGPVDDGRIKPEITAQGTEVWSAGFGSYWPNTGTSMSSPGVAGGLTLLYQHYKQLNGGTNPKNGLMKAILCNGATDQGNAGPDYTYGFGWMNLLRSAIMLEKNNYHINSIATGGTQNYALNVPANTAQLKVMLYWNDAAASVLSSHSLINDLDLEVIDPLSGVHLPFVLDTIPANVANAATTGVDHINNIEQVVLMMPAAGNYTLRVKGTAINQGPTQEYFLVYDTIPVATTLTYPVGKEKFHPGDSLYISWDAWGTPSNNFTLEYSKNNGGSWTTIDANISAVRRQYKWFVPSTDTTDQAMIRLSRNSTSMVSTSAAFTIIGPDTLTLSPTQFQCEGYIRVKWNKVIGATDYEAMILRGGEMIAVGTTTDTVFTYSGLSKDTLYWVSVRPRINGNPGLRSIAISRQPNNGDCLGPISDNDLKVDAIMAPAGSGRLFTSRTLSATETITARIKNLDDVASSSAIDISYSINGGAAITENISPVIAAGATYDHSFAIPADLSAAGTYNIQVTVTKASDPVLVNNSLTKTFKQLTNAPITIAELPWKDDFESAPEQSVNIDQMGLDGRDRYDFYNSTAFGRIRTFVNTGIAYSGSKALTLDIERYVAATNIDSLTATFNLATFNAATDDIRLDFRYKNHGQTSNAANRVWIRGTDASNWIQVYDLFANQNPADGSFKFTNGIELSDSLSQYLQNYSSSFQVRWGQAGLHIAADNQSRAGYTFDDIRLYRVTNDIHVLSIDTPIAISCGLSNAVPVRITLRNTANSTVNNIPVVLKVNGTVIATETISSINANTTIQYTFNPATADLSALGNHTVQVYADLASDTYRENDTVSVTVVNAPLITSFPYLQQFESGTAYWYSGGKNNSWEYGTPNSNKIKRAASGSKAWKTQSTGFYNDNELSYLYSPCFDLSGMTNPTLSLSLALDIEECSSLCDGGWVEYSTDGKNWTKLGGYGQGTNWYNKNYSGTNALWSDDDTSRWHVATIGLPTVNNSRLRFRFVFSADGGVTKEGMAIDDIHVYDNVLGIYDGPTMSTPVTQTINGGSNWINFTSGGKLIASVQPNNQSMGATDVQAYIHAGAVRNYNGQYYHNRNITIKPATTALGDSATVRFYFLDSETEALIAATGCSGCTRPAMAYELGVSKYSDPNDALEDGDVTNSTGMYWTFINATKAVKVPFDKGYYAEFKVKDFSEFWLNNGGFDNNHPLPVELVSFTANKTSNQQDVQLRWVTATELNTDKFEIEVARTASDFSQNRFTRIGEVQSAGNSTQQQQYDYLDAELNKTGTRYYRLKIVDLDGSYTYSVIRPVQFTRETHWQVFPNPSAGRFNLLFQLNVQERMQVKLYDASGRVVYQAAAVSNGFVQKLEIDLEAATFAKGVYLLEATGGGSTQTFKLLKQ